MRYHMNRAELQFKDLPCLSQVSYNTLVTEALTKASIVKPAVSLHGFGTYMYRVTQKYGHRLNLNNF